MTDHTTKIQDAQTHSPSCASRGQGVRNTVNGGGWISEYRIIYISGTSSMLSNPPNPTPIYANKYGTQCDPKIVIHIHGWSQSWGIHPSTLGNCRCTRTRLVILLTAIAHLHGTAGNASTGNLWESSLHLLQEDGWHLHCHILSSTHHNTEDLLQHLN